MSSHIEKDYQFLLKNLIPRHLLSSERIKGIAGAGRSGDRLTIVRESILAMEELAKRGIYERSGLTRSDGKVAVTYAQRDGRTSFTLELTELEWESLSPRPERKAGLVPSVLAGILSSLTLNGSGVSSTEKIEDILGLVEYASPGAEGRLLLFKESFIQGVRESVNIRESSVDEIGSSAFYGPVMGDGKIRTILRGEKIFEEKNYFRIGGDVGAIVLVPLAGNGRKFGILQVLIPDAMLPDSGILFNYNLIGQGLVRFLDNNRHLEEMVSVDRLTGANNRSYYDSQLPLEMERATRNRKSLGFLIMDIDDFKKFNDVYGHDTGDEVLKLVAATVRNHLRKIDLFFRFGGEEFIALLPGANREASERTAERIREVVSATAFATDEGENLHITLTIGGCVYPDDADNEKELFRKADKNLLEAKNSGKNRVQFQGGVD